MNRGRKRSHSRSGSTRRTGCPAPIGIDITNGLATFAEPLWHFGLSRGDRLEIDGVGVVFLGTCSSDTECPVFTGPGGVPGDVAGGMLTSASRAFPSLQAAVTRRRRCRASRNLRPCRGGRSSRDSLLQRVGRARHDTGQHRRLDHLAGEPDPGDRPGPCLPETSLSNVTRDGGTTWPTTSTYPTTRASHRVSATSCSKGSSSTAPEIPQAISTAFCSTESTATSEISETIVRLDGAAAVRRPDRRGAAFGDVG